MLQNSLALTIRYKPLDVEQNKLYWYTGFLSSVMALDTKVVVRDS